MKNIFDLSQHSSLDLDRLQMAIATGIVQCEDHKDLRELRDTLLSYKSITEQARKKALERESDEFASRVVQDISNGLM
jgi:ribosomal protein S9